ncbi:hypothetical protein BDY19DRAFT_871156, partial [Irpex rosettiformis]
WIVLCERWLTHERSLGFPDGSAPNRLPTKNRPEEVKYWLGRGRPYAKPPPIADAKRFGVEWKAWWLGLQPSWRGGKMWPLPQVVAAQDDVDWGALRRGGCNGLFLAVLSLGWW